MKNHTVYEKSKRAGLPLALFECRKTSVESKTTLRDKIKVLLDFFQKIAGVEGTESLLARRNERNLTFRGRAANS